MGQNMPVTNINAGEVTIEKSLDFLSSLSIQSMSSMFNKDLDTIIWYRSIVENSSLPDVFV